MTRKTLPLLAPLAGALALASLAAAAPVSADVLTFDGDICDTAGNVCSDGTFILPSYGDVPGVLEVEYRNLLGSTSLTQLRFWTSDYNDLHNVAWTDGGDSNSTAEIFLKPLNGDAVTLNSFDLGAWPDSQRNSIFTILDGDGNVLADSGGTIAIGIQPANLHSHFDFVGLTSTSGIRIQWGPSAYNVGIDNIDFTLGTPTPVPLPAPAWLFGGGLLTLLARRRNA